MIQQFYSWIYILKTQNTNSKMYKHPSIHGSISYNFQDMDSTQVSINRWKNKDMVYIHNGILLSHKK